MNLKLKKPALFFYCILCTLILSAKVLKTDEVSSVGLSAISTDKKNTITNNITQNTQAAPSEIDINYTDVLPVIDGVEDAIWAEVTPIPIEKYFQAEMPTVTATWKALWSDNGIYVLLNVEDDDHYPSWESTGNFWAYDWTQILFDVNETLIDGGGPVTASGHYQSAPGFAETGYDLPVIGSPFDTRDPGGDYAYHLDGQNYVYEQFFPFENFFTGENGQMDKDAFTSRPIGFDVTISDQDVGITTSRQRAVWMQDGTGDVPDESWNTMDGAGTITLKPADFFQLSVNTSTVSAKEGSQSSVTISANVPWTASSDQLWLDVSPESGTDNGTLTFTANENTEEIRTAIVTVSSPGLTDKTITITQLSGFELGQTSLSLISIGGSPAVSITATVDWTASSDQLWLTVSPESGSDNGVLTLTVNQNTGNIRTAIVTVSSEGLSDKTITVNQNAQPIPFNINVNYTAVSPVIDGIEDAIWDEVTPIPIEKYFQVETPTVTAYWKSMWADDGLYVLLNVEDDDHYPSWKSSGNFWDFDWTQINFDVNETLIDGRGPANNSTGHYQSYPGFAEVEYDVPVFNVPPTGNTPGGDYAYHLDGQNYVYEQFFPFENFFTGENVGMDKDAFTSRPIGFDVTITDQDEGVTTSRQRMVWMQDGTGDVPDESWNTMDGAGTITLIQVNFFQLSADTATVSALEGSQSSVNIIGDVPWTASSDQPWLDVSPGTGIGNDTLIFTAEANTETITRTATVTVSSPGLIDEYIIIIQDALVIKKDVDINYTAALPVIDGVEDAIWAEVTPIPIEKYFQVETPTVTAYWKAMWANEGIYVMLNVQDDNHWPGWESGRSFWEYDNSEIYFDVNDTLADGLGPKTPGSGHYQAYTCFVPELYGVTIENEPPTTQYTGGTFAYSLSGENYSIERFIPFKNFIDKNGTTLNRSTFLEKGKIGFDIYVVDQDEGITTSRQRKVWQNEAVYNESWNNMDDCGTITLAGINLLQSDSLALIAFYNATNGTGWTNNTNWLTGPLNSWYGVTISGDRVTQLNLQNNHLWGYLPAEIGNLTALTSLSISHNYQITGSIPDEIGNLSELTVLNLFNNGHSGNIPSSIWNLTNLTTLNLGACWSLEGAFPSEIGNLINLTQLNLWGIGLTGSIPPSIGNLSSLWLLDLGSNNLSGTIPSEIGNMSSLVQLYLSNNSLSGIIPTEFGNLSNLEYCSLLNNHLAGSIPENFGNLSKLYSLQLNNNSLSGNIPTEFGNLSNLQYCYLNDNQLSGDLPASFSTILETKAAPTSQKTESLNNDISNGFINPPTIGSDGLQVGDAPTNLLANLNRLQVQNNRFTFANIQASGITPGSIDYFLYAPQDTILGLTFIPDHSLTVNDGKALNSVYQWYYCSKLITGETNDTLVDINPTGDYYCGVTNTTYPGLELTSEVYGIPGQGFTLSNDTVTVAATEGSTVSLSISSQIEWTATPNETWLSVNPESGTGNGSITVRGSVNGGEKRTGTITVSSPGYRDLTLTVIQLSALEVDPTTISISELEGSTATLNVIASVDWTVSSDQLWLSVAPESGSGNGTITLTAAKNKGPIRLATVTFSSQGFSDRVITVTQATFANIYVLFTPTSPVIDGVEEAIWNTIVPIPISKDFQTETPTVTAYWKSMWCDSGLFVLMNVQDDDHWPAWKTGGNFYAYDWTQVNFDVNETLIDGSGPFNNSSGHYQSYPGFDEEGYDVPVFNTSPTGNTPGGAYAYHLDGENYVYEQFFPFGNFYTEENVQMDKDAFTSRPIGFDITITDQDEGITISRQRAVWMQDGLGDVIDESWNNMDDAGTIRLVHEVFNVAPVANAGNDQWVNETVKAHLNGFTSSDADGDELSYLWTAPAGITLSSNTAAQPTFTAPSVSSPATYCFTLVVNDGIVNSVKDTVIVHVMNAVPPEHFETVWTGDAIDQMNINVVSVNIDSIEMEPGDEIGVFDGDLCVGVGVYPGVTRKRNIAWLGMNIRADSLYFVELSKAGYNVVDKTATKGDLTLTQIADLDTFDLVILSRSLMSSDYRYPEKYDAIQSPFLCMANMGARYTRLRMFPPPNLNDPVDIQDSMAVVDFDHPIFNNLTLSGSNKIDIANPGILLKPLMDQKSAGNGNLIGVTSIDSLVLIAEWDAKQPYYEGSVDTLHGKRMVYFNTAGSNGTGQSESFLSNNGYQLLKNIAEYMITGSVDTPDIIPIVVSADDGSGNGYTPGHKLTFKLYDSSIDKEIENVSALYLDDDPSWSTDGKFSQGATAFVELIGSVVPQNLTVGNLTLSNGVIDCFNAYDTIMVAGGGKSVVLETNSTATFIAGASIRFLPGFHAESGSNMDAYITTTGSFCDLIEPGIVEVIALEKSTPEGDLPKHSIVEGERLLRVYPNPNNGCFKIELTNFENKASVCVYNSLGIRVYRSEAGSLPIREINLPAISKGIYFVRVADGKEQFTKKMVVK